MPLRQLHTIGVSAAVACLAIATATGGCQAEIEPDPVIISRTTVPIATVPQRILEQFRQVYPDVKVVETEHLVARDGSLLYALEFITPQGDLRRAVYYAEGLLARVEPVEPIEGIDPVEPVEPTVEP